MCRQNKQTVAANLGIFLLCQYAALDPSFGLGSRGSKHVLYEQEGEFVIDEPIRLNLGRRRALATVAAFRAARAGDERALALVS
jgi:hypothetical protein